MIKKLQRKFIVLATSSMFVLMAILVGAMNLINYSSVVRECDDIINIISLPNTELIDNPNMHKEFPQNSEHDIPPGMSPEVPYESRYFSVIVSEDGDIIRTDMTHIISVDSKSIKEYVDSVINKNHEKGFIGNFRFLKSEDTYDSRIVFLDCGRKLEIFYSFLWSSIVISLSGCIIVFLVFILAAKHIVHPIAESYRKQKQFITDAGHEIKTPLTIIRANIDLLEDDVGENECLSDIKQQITRLTGLTGDLVNLSKMEESENTLQKIDFPVSDLVYETASSFRAIAQEEKKEYILKIKPMITLNGSPDAFRQLVMILIENAIKYSPNGGIITVNLNTKKKMLELSVFNTTIEKVSSENIEMLFERFYRSDASRNSETGGHGIGLSIAKAIVKAHSGKIFATTQNGFDFCITVNIPL